MLDVRKLARVWKTRRNLATVTIVALAGLAAVLLAAEWPFSQSKVLKSIRDRWPGTANADRVRSTYFPHPGCVIENLVLALPSNRSQEPALITIGKARIESSYIDLFLRPRHLTRLIIEGLRVEVPVYSSIRSNKDTTGESVQSATSFDEVETRDAVLIVNRSRGAPALDFRIHHVVLRSVSGNAPMFYEASLALPEPPAEVHVRGRFGPWVSKELKDVPLSGSYTLEDADLGKFPGIAGVLSSSGSFDGPFGQIRTQGTIDIPGFQVTRSHHEVALKATFDASVDATRGDVNLKTVDARFLGTAVHADGTIGPTQADPGKTASLNLNVQHGQIQDVLDLFVASRVPPMDGIADFQTHVVIPPGHERFLEKLQMEGSFLIAHAVLTNQARQSDIDVLSKRASGNKKQKETERVDGRIDGKLRLRNGSALFTPVSFQIPGASIVMTGRFNLLNQQIDFHGEARTQAKLSDDTVGVKAVLLKPINSLFKKKDAGAEIPVEMTGSYDSPHFGVELPIKK
jgi:AsmA-like protein